MLHFILPNMCKDLLNANRIGDGFKFQGSAYSPCTTPFESKRLPYQYPGAGMLAPGVFW